VAGSATKKPDTTATFASAAKGATSRSNQQSSSQTPASVAAMISPLAPVMA
jgi:hypothetical protein